jgi:hypothetical protein
MFGINLKALRWALNWNFAFLSLLCIVLAPRIILSTFQHQLKAASSHPFALVLDAVFPAMAAVFGVAWWKVWKQRPSARIWGIAASVLLALYPLSHIIRFPRSIHGHTLLVLAVAIVGIIAFSIRERVPPEQNDQALEEPPDGET